MAFPSHASGHALCMLCKMTKTEIMDQSMDTVIRNHPPDYYESECARHELWVLIETEDVHREIRFNLSWRSNSRGRCLDCDLLHLSPPLRKNDRLEAHSQMLDVATFDTIKKFPAMVKFWRERKDSRVYQ